MSPTGTSGNAGARGRVGKSRTRAIMFAAALGALAAVPVAVNAANEAPAGPTERGTQFVPGKDTPAAVKTALQGDHPVVVAFLLPGITEDEIVQKRLNNLQKEAKFRDTKFVVYRVQKATKLGDLVERLDIKYTPAVAVFQGDNKLSNVWRGLVDEDIVAQSLTDARNAVPHALRALDDLADPKGDAAGIALAKKVNKSYAKAKGVSMTGQAIASGAPVEIAFSARLADGAIRSDGGSVTVAGEKLQVFTNITGAYRLVEAAGCWERSMSLKAMQEIGDGVIQLGGTAFGKPKKQKDGNWTLPAKDNSGVVLNYLVDGKSNQVAQVAFGKAGKYVVKYAALDTVPALVKPEKLC